MNFQVQTTQRKRDKERERDRDDFEEEHRVEPLKKNLKGGDKIRWEKLKLHSYGILIIKN